MDVMEQTEAQKTLEEANHRLSKACLEYGRQHGIIEDIEAELASAKTALHNYNVELEKAKVAYKKALRAEQAESQTRRANPLPDVPEVSPEPQLELIQ